MNLDGLGGAGAWLGLALALSIAELAAPGVFLIFVALAAAITGLVLLAIPDLPLIGQLASFALWSVIAVVIGRRWHLENPVESEDALLNDRSARLIGEVVSVVEPIEHDGGRVRVGDSIWLARGPEVAAGERVRVIATDGAVLVVELLT